MRVNDLSTRNPDEEGLKIIFYSKKNNNSDFFLNAYINILNL